MRNNCTPVKVYRCFGWFAYCKYSTGRNDCEHIRGESNECDNPEAIAETEGKNGKE